MRTSFLPAEDEPLIVQQGTIGDCAVLAAFMCIYNSTYGRHFLKSIYQEQPWGVIIRLKHTDQSRYLDSDAFKEKYGYYHDQYDNQDMFFITNSVLDTIDASYLAVKTNALLLQVLIRLFSKYFAFPSDKKKRHGSLDAYDASPELDPYPNLRSAEFIGKLLGLSVEKLTDTAAIERHQIDPQAMYVSMNYSGTASNRRHALTLDRIIPDVNHEGEFKFVLVNPWDNQKNETYTAAELRSKQGNFFIFIVNPERYSGLKFKRSSEGLINSHC